MWRQQSEQTATAIRIGEKGFARRWGGKSNFVYPTKVLLQMRLSEGVAFKTCAIPPARDQKSAEQTSLRTKLFKHIAIEIIQEHLPNIIP